MKQGPLLEERFYRLKEAPALLQRLAGLFGAMGGAYDDTAARYGFDCGGCEENCCTQRFHHHTLTEYFFLLEGLQTAAPEHRGEVLRRAREVAPMAREDAVLPLMCPVNFDGLCSLYEHRPMICRLHGLPHLFRRPDGAVHEGGGCHRFEESHRPSARLDRTRFYLELADVERQLRGLLGFTARVKKTTAEMLVDMAGYLDRRTQK